MNLSFGRVIHRLAIAILLPLLGMLFFAGREIYLDSVKIHKLGQHGFGQTLAASASAAVHQLQIERAKSAGFLNAGGGLFADHLAIQYEVSDQAMEEYQILLESVTAEKVGARVYTAALEAADSFRGIIELRLQIAEQGLTVSEMTEAYTRRITQLIAIIENTRALFVDAEAAEQLSSYLFMIKAKESASLERAMGAAGFGAGYFSTPIYRRLVTEISEQAVFLREFRTHAAVSVIAAYDHLFSGPEQQRVMAMRKVALAFPDTGALNGISGEDWFRTASTRIELMKNIENQIAVEAGTYSENVLRQLRHNRVVLIAELILIFGASGFMVWVMISTISRPLTAMALSVVALSEGQRGVTIPSSEAQDEIGDMARALETIRDAGVRSVRVQTALDCASTAVMMVNASGQVVYANDRVEQMFAEAADDLAAIVPASLNPAVGQPFNAFHPDSGVLPEMLETGQGGRLQIGPRHFDLVVNPVINRAGDQLGTVVEWADITEEVRANEGRAERARFEQERLGRELAIARENQQIRQALDSASAAVMVADDQGMIIYHNRAAGTLFKGHEDSIRKVVPDFSVSEVIGTNIDRFHKDPAHQRDLLRNLTGVHHSSIAFHDRTFHLTATQVVGDEGRHLGAAVEWQDVTDQLAVEERVQNLVTSAAAGDFSNRLDTTTTSGFMKALSESINEVMERVETSLGELSSVIANMADGNLTSRMVNDYQGVFKELKNDTNRMAGKMEQVVARINISAGAVSSGASEIALGTDDLSSRTESQASALQQTASSMEEMASIVKNSSENAGNASNLAEATREAAREGAALADQAVSAMGKLETSSARINEITGVIDEIAFQTNLLALNAAVEAARAGDAGKGFAVVASEVRSLAQRSAEAAKDIKGLIALSTNEVRSSAALVNQAGKALNDIVNAISDVADIMTRIAGGAHEQAAGIEQISASVSTMEGMTQQNASLVEQSAAAAGNLADQSRQLTEMMSFFVIDDASMTGAQKGETLHKNPSLPPSPEDIQKPEAPLNPILKRYTGEEDDDWAEF